MIYRNFLVLVVLVLSAQSAWASFDDYCEPHWALNQGGYSRCSNLPVLAPANDTRVNLKLLLVDNGFAKLAAKPVDKDDANYGYGKVPFSVDTFDSGIFLPGDKSDGAEDEDSTGSGNGTRCVSNDSGKEEFIEAVNNSRKLSASERQFLIEERQKLIPTCVDAPQSAKLADIDKSGKNAKNALSPAGKEFMRYIVAARAFYEGRYGDAGADFAALAKSNQPWLRETSRYMVGRTELNRSQQNAFDEYGYPTLENVDRKALLSAEAKLDAYLKSYPDGRYAASARGLLRRVYWMSKRPRELSDEYVWQMNHPQAPQRNLSLDAMVREADCKLFPIASPEQITDPMLLATLDLSLMRPADSSGVKPISFSELRKQGPVFNGHKALYEYLLTAHRFYVQKDPAGALKDLSDKIPAKMTYLDFSRLTLRGLALESLKDHREARKLWMGLMPVSGQPLQAETLQLAIALNYEHAGEPGLAFAANSPITEKPIRDILIRSDASADLLRRIIKTESNSPGERRLAIYTLLYKDLMLGHYCDYIRDYPLLPGNAAKYTQSPDMDGNAEPHLALFTWSGKETDDGYSCPSTLDIADKLAKNPTDPIGLICLGDFVNSNDLDSGPGLYRYPTRQSSDVTLAGLGSAPSHFPGKIFSRGDGYKTILADANASTDQKAYSLYRSIKCYSPAGDNHCGGKDVEQSVRKSWFQTLKTRYAKSVWAKKLRYYW